jgi:hypothetical protein
MITNVTLESKDREIFGIKVRQETKNGFMSLTDLQQAYEKARWIHKWSERSVYSVINALGTQEKIYHLLKERNIIDIELSGFLELIENNGLINVLKKLQVWKTTGRGDNRNVICDSYIWTLLAMELNPMLYAKVVIWLTDSLIFDRIEAGDKFKPMNAAISRILPKPDYPTYAREINIRVFGYHESQMRNLAGSKQLKLISEIENTVKKAIDHGWIKTEQDILKLIRTY